MIVFTKKEIDSYLNSLIQLISVRLEERIKFLDYEHDVFSSLIMKLSSGEGLVFNTLFSRISYIGIKFKLRSGLLSDIHLFRKEYEKNKEINSEVLYDLGIFLLKELLRIGGVKALPEKVSSVTRPDFTLRKKEIVKRKINGRYNLIGKKNSDEYIVIDDDDPTDQKLMRVDALETFKNSIDYLDEKIKNEELPVVMSLVYIDIDAEGVLMPQLLIIQPDYLIDVTTIAECFKPHGGHAKYFLLNKLSFDSYSLHITTGNIVNYFLDQLINEPEIEFENIIGEIFQLDPIRFTMMEDKEIQSLVKTLKIHFANIKRVVNEDLRSINIDPEKCVLEPSFYSPVFGLQGRLDVFHKNKNNTEAAIIELKSGKLFMPNIYGLNTNHYTQTLLYELMIRSVYNFKLKPINFILYSAIDKQNIRFAPTISAQQKEAVSIRNDIVALEEKIVSSNNIDNILKLIGHDNFPAASGFILRDIEKINEVFNKMNETEKAYYGHFVSFIAREQRNAKIGYQREGLTTGQAALWLLDEKQKTEHFSILQKLKLSGISEADNSIIFLKKTENTNELANFRKGDIVLLYPYKNTGTFQIESQIFKCTITDFRDDIIEIKLRTTLRNIRNEAENVLWNLEHDYLDTGFAKMHSALIKFFNFPEKLRDKILTLSPPEKNDVSDIAVMADDLTEMQSEMVKKILSCKDYFLLWGPPGTGKTSKIIRTVADELTRNNENIMVVAYTNRAVDELCEAIESVNPTDENNYIRVGSRYSCAEKYQCKLLDVQVRNLKTRVALANKLNKTRVFVSTVSSLMGKEEIFDLKKFDTIIVDEASQLLEPMIISILPNFRRFILVGDHMQLPAVVSQDRDASIVKDKLLNNIGLTDLSNSLFERMFSRAVSNKWEWSYGMLHEQGRMHVDIMKFPNSNFYHNELKEIGHLPILRSECKLKHKNDLQKELITQRMIYCPTSIDKSGLFAKNNIDEADKIVKLITEWKEIYDLNGMALSNESIGIITTFRAQIATIKNRLIKSGIVIQNISIDTVERYQGSARDIIIYSMSVNSIPRFEQIINPDKNELDRKLNVVITRAKEHFIILGNEEILKSNKLYRQLIGEAWRVEIRV